MKRSGYDIVYFGILRGISIELMNKFLCVHKVHLKRYYYIFYVIIIDYYGVAGAGRIREHIQAIQASEDC